MFPFLAASSLLRAVSGPLLTLRPAFLALQTEWVVLIGGLPRLPAGLPLSPRLAVVVVPRGAVGLRGGGVHGVVEWSPDLFGLGFWDLD